MLKKELEVMYHDPEDGRTYIFSVPHKRGKLVERILIESRIVGEVETSREVRFATPQARSLRGLTP